jgi:hypothetical protein
MGVLGQSRDQGAAAVVPNVAGPPAPTDLWTKYNSNVPVLGAGFRQAVAGPHSTRNAEAIYRSRPYDQIIQILNQNGERAIDYVESPVRRDSPFYRPVAGERVNPNGVVYVPVKRLYRNPFSAGPSLTKDINPITSFYGGGDRDEIDQIWAGVARLRQRNPALLKAWPEEAALAKWSDEQRKRDLAASQSVIDAHPGTSAQVVGFAGGVGGSLASGDPENFVGGGFGTAAGKTVARTVIKRAVEGAGANAAAALVAAPGQIVDANHLGQEMSDGDIARQVGEAAATGAGFGAAHIVIPKAAGKAGSVVSSVTDKVTSIAPVRDALVAASIRAGTISDHSLLSEWARAHNPGGIVDTSSPDERAAAHVIIRDAATRETSPLHPEAAGANDHRLDKLAESLGVDMKAPEMPTPAPVQAPTVRDRAQGGRRPAGYADAINQAEGHTLNPRSSADGYGNFIDSTWLAIAPRVADTKGMSRDQILALRHDRSIASRATELYAADNGRYLHARGLEDSPGNLSLAHFLGPEGAAKLLKAAPDAPVESLLPAEVVHANREVLQGKSASEVIAWAHKRIGAAVDMPVARADAVPDADLLDDADYSDVPYERATFTPDEVRTNAELMQYKAGGDENGVTGKLKDVTEWNPLMSSEILAWQPKEGPPVVVDGHQRVGLAKRLSAEGQQIDLPALIVREADGITAAQARVLGALRNINLGTGSLIDNARVLRDVPEGVELIRGAENRRDIEGLAKLGYQAFGAAINDVIDPRIAAQIGRYAPDPSTHMSLVALLAKERVRDPKEAATIVRQAVADGFGTGVEQQLGMFGDEPQHSLYVPIARILEASAKRLREEKRTFKVLSEKAGRIEAVGNVLDRTANEEKVVGSDEALAILERTAHSAGPVRGGLIAAARAELSGARRGDAVNGFLDALAGIDLRAAARGLTEDGAVREPSGEAGGRDAAAASDEFLASSHGPELFDHAIAAKEAAEPFGDPHGEAAKAQTALLDHDLRAQIDPAIAERRKQETALKAEAPMRSIAEQEGTMGLSLFDVADQPTFRLSDEGEAQPLAEIMRDAEADELAAQALKDCLK